MIVLTYEIEASTVDQETGDQTLTAGLRTLEFDAVITSSPETTAELTDKAVEGAASSDHKRIGQRTIAVDAWVSNTPLGAPPPGGLDSTISADQVAQDSGGTVAEFSEEFDRVRGVFNELDRLVRNAVAITLSTPTQEYEDVQLVSMKAPTTQETGTDAIQFSLEFVEVRVVETRLADTPIPREPRGARAGDSGDQNPAEDEESNQEENQSTLSEWSERFDNFVNQ